MTSLSTAFDAAPMDEKGAALLAQTGATHVLVSLSHTALVAMAVAALVRCQD